MEWAICGMRVRGNCGSVCGGELVGWVWGGLEVVGGGLGGVSVDVVKDGWLVG